MNKKIWLELYTRALQTRIKAYAPYSGFQVGAALFFSDQSIAVGCNVENISNGATICAERTALLSAVSHHGGRNSAQDLDILAIAVVTQSKTPAFPCGLCLQTLGEFVQNPRKTKVRAYSVDGKSYKEFSFHQLAPQLFTRFNFRGAVKTKK